MNRTQIHRVGRVERTLLETLTSVHGPHCLSLYLELDRVDAPANAIRLRDALREARDALTRHAETRETSLSPADLDEILAPAEALVADRALPRGCEGMALFLGGDSRGSRQAFLVPSPVSLPALVLAGTRFHVAPLFALLDEAPPFAVLALGIEGAEVFIGDRFALTPHPVPDMPSGLQEVVGGDVQQRMPQVHGRMGASTRRGVYHGHGAGSETEKKVELEPYLRAVDAAVAAALPDPELAVVSLGVGYVRALHRSISALPGLLDDGIDGSPETELNDLEKVHAQALALLKPIRTAAKDRSAARFGDLIGTGLASDQLGAIVRAAERGQVDALFVPRGSRRFGDVDGEGAVRDGAPKDSEHELVDRAVVDTFAKGGAVYLVEPAELPSPRRRMSAVYRF